MKIIDCDSHIIPSTVYDNVAEQYRHLLPKFVYDNNNLLVDVQFDVDPATCNNSPNPVTFHCKLAGISSIAHRIQDLTKIGVDMQLLAPQELAMRFNYSVEKNLAAEMAHSYNIEIKKIVDQYPNKFFAVALIPAHDFDLAMKEMEWALENKFSGIYIDMCFLDSAINYCRPWSTVEYVNQIFAWCEKNDVIIYMHGQSHHVQLIPDTFTELKQQTGVCKVSATFYDLITSGVLDQYPSLKIIVAENVDLVIKKIITNLVTGYETNRHLFKCINDPLYYFKKNIFITVDIERRKLVQYMIDTIGSERLLFSTDYPHDDPSGLNKWNDVRDLYTANLTQQQLENIAYRNAQTLFNL